jgi:hypothetical protein
MPHERSNQVYELYLRVARRIGHYRWFSLFVKHVGSWVDRSRCAACSHCPEMRWLRVRLTPDRYGRAESGLTVITTVPLFTGRAQYPNHHTP